LCGWSSEPFQNTLAGHGRVGGGLLGHGLGAQRWHELLEQSIEVNAFGLLLLLQARRRLTWTHVELADEAVDSARLGLARSMRLFEAAAAALGRLVTAAAVMTLFERLGCCCCCRRRRGLSDVVHVEKLFENARAGLARVFRRRRRRLGIGEFDMSSAAQRMIGQVEHE